MAYGMQQLRKAGEAIRGFDDAYSRKIEEFYTGRFENSRKTGADMEVKTTAGLMLGGATPSFRKGGVEVSGKNPHPMEHKIAAALNVALPIESAVVKYALPAAGVTLAGKGLVDIAGALSSNPGDYQESGQLPMS